MTLYNRLAFDARERALYHYWAARHAGYQTILRDPLTGQFYTGTLAADLEVCRHRALGDFWRKRARNLTARLFTRRLP